MNRGQIRIELFGLGQRGESFALDGLVPGGVTDAEQRLGQTGISKRRPGRRGDHSLEIGDTLGGLLIIDTREIEPNQDRGWCAVCDTKSVKSALTLAEIL